MRLLLLSGVLEFGMDVEKLEECYQLVAGDASKSIWGAEGKLSGRAIEVFELFWLFRQVKILRMVCTGVNLLNQASLHVKLYAAVNGIGIKNYDVKTTRVYSAKCLGRKGVQTDSVLRHCASKQGP